MGSEEPWIEWRGGRCPVAADRPVQVRFRCWDACVPHDSLRKNPPMEAREFAWAHRGMDSDIVAYRITPNA